MENLLNGMPQALDSGPTLLALGAWNLYPDILLVSNETTEVQFNDSLIAPGGTLTIGLTKSENEDQQGVSWSLSLAYLRYYGHPIQARRRLSRDSARVTFHQFCQATLGALLGCWDVNEARSHLFVEIFAAIQDTFERELGTLSTSKQNDSANKDGKETPPSQSIIAYMRDSSHWFHLLATAVQTYVDEKIEEHVTARKLVRKGIRQSSKFIGNTKERWSMFKLMHRRTLFGILKGPEELIAYLRHIATRYSFHPDDVIIQYHDGLGRPQYATALPQLRKLGPKRKHSSRDGEETSVHRRWLSKSHPCSDLRDLLLAKDEELIWSEPGDFWNSAAGTVEVQPFSSERKRFDFYDGLLEQACILVANKNTTPPATSTSSSASYPAYYHPQHSFENPLAVDEVAIPVEDFLTCSKSKWISPESLLWKIESHLDPLGDIFRTMSALSTISVIYRLLPDATIAIETLNQPLYRTLWNLALYHKNNSTDLEFNASTDRHRRHGMSFNTRMLDRGIAFSCVAYLESGQCNVAPAQLKDVIALSCGDSIYVAMGVSILL